MKHLKVSENAIVNLEYVAATMFNVNREEVVFSMANGVKVVCDFTKMLITRDELERKLLE